MAKKITFLDKTFWLTESNDNPKHVASLQLLSPPEGATEGYVDELVAHMREFNQAQSPFNSVVETKFGFPVRLREVEQLDMQYHVQYHSIANVDDRPALHQFVARLHEERLYRGHPLWQFHVIKGEQSRTFCIYVKIHHMYGDGATMIRWFQAGYSDTPSSTEFLPVWAVPPKRRRRRLPRSKVQGFFAGLWDFLIATKDLLWIFVRLLVKLVGINRHYMPVPFSGTRTVLTGQVKKGRVVSTCDLDFGRVKALSRRLRATANEILLCCFDIGVHRFLMDYGHRFQKALYTNMPINLRKPGEETGGNKIAIVPVRLAHGDNDPYLRLRKIIENHRVVKRAAKNSHPASFSYYTVLIQSFALLFELLHVSDWFKPIANILISNVPGPKEPRYMKDAKLEAVYPISTIVPGGGVNITLLTYADTANIGLVASNRRIKSLEPMAAYFVEAFEMLEACIDNPDLNIEDIGEQVVTDYKSVVEDHSDKHHEDDDGEDVEHTEQVVGGN